MYQDNPNSQNNKYFCKLKISQTIFGLKQLPSYKLHYLLVCEGEKDVLVCAAHGIPAVCFQSASTLPSKAQIRQLSQKASYIIVCYDNDIPGQQGALKITEQFELIKYELDEKYNDVAEYLPNADSEDFKSRLKTSIQSWREDNDVKLWEHELQYYSLNRSKKAQEVSNFIIEVDAMIKSNEYSFRLVRLRSKTYTTPTLRVDSNVFTSEQRFVEFCESQRGNFLFFGSKNDLQEIKKRVFHLSDYLDEVDFSGYDSERNIYVFKNGIIKAGKFHRPNKFNIVEHLYIPEDSDQNKYYYANKSTITLKQFLEFLKDSYSKPIAILGLSYMLASLYFDFISKQLKFFPLLNVSGQKGSWKGYIN